MLDKSAETRCTNMASKIRPASWGLRLPGRFGGNDTSGPFHLGTRY